MPVRKNISRSSAITAREISLLQRSLAEGYPYITKSTGEYVPTPPYIDTQLEIILSHLTGVFTLAAGFPTEPHPSNATVKQLKTELKDAIATAEKKYGAHVPKNDRWTASDLRRRNWLWGPREVY